MHKTVTKTTTKTSAKSEDKSPTPKIELKTEFIAIKYLSVVWQPAQRPFSPAWAKQIADEFDDDKFEPPVVTKVHDSSNYHIVEGQHRVAAAKILFGEDCVLQCRVIQADTMARAAEIWLGINAARKAISTLQEFMVAVTAQREPETEINKMVHKMGYRVAGQKTDYCISAVASLMKIFQRYGKDGLQLTLNVVDQMWAGESAAFNGDLLKGFAAFLNEFHHKLDFKRFGQVLTKAVTPQKLLTVSRSNAEQGDISLTEAIIAQLIKRYNNGLHADKRLKRKASHE
jgi:hypothetical protein